MKARISNAEKVRRLRRAQELAVERATAWWVWTTTAGGDIKQARIVQAKSEKEALRRFRHTVSVKPSLPTSVWREIYEEVGL